MIDESLINLKKELKSHIDIENGNALNIFTRIHCYCLNTYNFSRLSSILTVTFNDEPKLLDICDYNKKKGSHIIIEEFCDFVNSLINFSQQCLLPFAVSIKEYLVGILKMKNSTAKMKELSVKTLQNVFSLVANTDMKMNEVELLNGLFLILQGKPPSTVLGSILELIGKINLLYPQSISSVSNCGVSYEKMTIQYLTLEITSQTKPAVASVIAGCFEGLRFYYLSISADNIPQDVYDLLLKVIQMDTGKRYTAVKSSLHFFADHCCRMKTRIFNDIQIILERLSSLCNFQNIDLKSTAEKCLESLLTTIGKDLNQKAINGSLSFQEKCGFDFIVQTFTENIQQIQPETQRSINTKTIDSEIKGLGYFIKECFILFSKEIIEKLYILIADFAWKEFHLDKGDEQIRAVFEISKIYRMVEILKTLINLLHGLLESGQFETTKYCRILEVIIRLTITFIEFFPRISRNKFYLYKDIFYMISNNLGNFKSVYKKIIEEIVYQAIIFTCSFPPPPDYSIVQDFSFDTMEIDEDTESNEIIKTFAASSLQDFLSFWIIIMKSDKTENDELASDLFEAFLKCEMIIIDRLDLNYKALNNDKLNNDPMANKSASNPKDFFVFVNLCELFKFIMNFAIRERILKWAVYCVNHFVTKSLEWPLISGFHKLICSIIRTLHLFDYFHGSSEVMKSNEVEMKSDEFTSKESIICDLRRLLNSIIEKMCQYNDELLLSCLGLLVNVPVTLWIYQHEPLYKEKVLSYMKMAIQLGNSYLPLGQGCVDMLERLIKYYPCSKSWIDSILPSFRVYLSHASTTSSSDIDKKQRHKMQIKSLLSAGRSHRNLTKTLLYIQEIERLRLSEEMGYEGIDNSFTTRFRNLQVRVMIILGRLGMKRCKAFMNLSSKHFSNDVNWINSPSVIIPFSIPFTDIKPQFPLERFLTSVCTLALNSTDYQIKSVASEVLHAVILVTIGQSATCIKPSDRDKFVPVWSYVFNVSLKLATDMNKVCKTLFSELLYQVAYWYSYPYNAELQDLDCFIDCLFDTIIREFTEDPNLPDNVKDTNSGNLQRDLAGRVLFHLLQSSFDHNDTTDATGLSSSKILKRHSVMNILERIYFLSQNFSPFKRLGAIFILNSIYPILKKDEQMLKEEVFIIFYHLVVCLRLSEKDKHLGTLNQLNYAFDNVNNTIMIHKLDLNVKHEDRKKPPFWLEATIEVAVRWVLKFLLTDHRHFRQKCIDLSESLAQNYDENNQGCFLQALYKAKGKEYFYNKFESPELFEQEPTIENQNCWMNTLEASLQTFSRFLQLKIVDVEDYFSVKSGSKLLRAVNNFFESFLKIELSNDLFFLSKNVILFFTNLLLSSNGPFDNSSQIIIDMDNLIRFSVIVSLQPYRINFDLRNKIKVKKWMENIKRFINSMNSDLQNLYFEKASSTLSLYNFSQSLVCVVDSFNRNLELFEIKYLFKMFKLLTNIEPSKKLLDESIHNVLFKDILEHFTNEKDEHNFIMHIIQSSILDYLFSLSEQCYLDQIISILNKNNIRVDYHKSLFKGIMNHPEKIILQFNTDNISNILPVLSLFLEHEIRNKSKKKCQLVRVLMDNWSIISLSNQLSISIDQSHQDNLLRLLMQMIIIDPLVCNNQKIMEYFCNVLSSQTYSIKFKEIFPIFNHFYRFSTNDELTAKLIDSVHKYFNINFTALSKDLLKNLEINECYLNSISSMFQCLKYHRCSIKIHLTMIRKVVIPIFCREESHPLDKDLRESLIQFCSKLSNKDQIEILTAFENELNQLKNYENIILFLNKFYLVSILQTDSDSLMEFFGPRINLFIDSIQDEIIEKTEIHKLQRMIVNIEIIDTIYKALGPYKNQEKLNLRDSKLISDLSKKLYSLLQSKRRIHSDQFVDGIVFNLRACAFNCLCAVVIATQIQEKFYLQLLLNPKLDLFQHIISEGCMKDFPTDILIVNKKKVEFYSCSDSGYITQSVEVPTVTRSIQEPHIHSQFLFDSSLAFDVNKLESILNLDTADQFPEPKSNIERPGRYSISIEVTDDVINNHKCMKTFIWLLHHMEDLGFISINSDSSCSDIPKWMEVIHSSFTDNNTYIDIKCFISKLLLNCHKIFHPYGSLWISDLINFVVSTKFGMNSFVGNIIELIIQWCKKSDIDDNIPETDINKLVKHVADNCYDENVTIARRNGELFHILIKKWTNKVTIPYKPLFDNLKDLNTSSRIICGLQMLASVLSNGYLFMVGSSIETKSDFVKMMLKNLQHKSKLIYGPSFELCGLILKQYQTDPDPTFKWEEDLGQKVNSALKVLYSRNASEYVTSLALITKNYVSLLLPQISSLISILNFLKDKDLCKALEIMGSVVCETKDWVNIHDQLYQLHLFQNMDMKLSSTTKALIQVINRTISNISDWKSNQETNVLVMKSFECCITCCQHEDSDVRSSFYQLLINLCGQEICFNEETLFKSLQWSLLMGLMDRDKIISQSIRNFCSYSQSLSKETLKRSNVLLNVLFPSSLSSDIESLNRSKFLGIATNMLLEMTLHSPDFAKPLFPKQLDDKIVFEKLTTAFISSQTSSRSMLPNFLKTDSKFNIISASHSEMFKIPTSSNIPKKSVNFDWLKLASTLTLSHDTNNSTTKSSIPLEEWSVASSQIPGVEMEFSVQSQSSYLSLDKLENEKVTLKEKREKEIFDHSISKPNAFDSSKQKDDMILKNRDYYYEKAVGKTKRLEKNKIIKRNLEESAVFLFGNYHKGKVPNIQIQNGSIITSLQMLAHFDDNFSKELFYHLYKALLLESSSIRDQMSLKSYYNNLSNSFDNILKTCTVQYKIPIACCLQLAIDNCSTIQLTPELIYESSVLTNNQILATILLEKYLILYSDNQISFPTGKPLVKKPKLSSTINMPNIVSLLMRLYKHFNLNEEILGLLCLMNRDEIFSNDSFIITFKTSIESECLGDYANSLNLYHKLLTEKYSFNYEDSDDLKNELLLLSQSGYINSLEKLCNWSELSTFLESMVTDHCQPANYSVLQTLIYSKLRTLVSSDLNDWHNNSDREKLVTLISTLQGSYPNFELIMPMEMSLFYIVQTNYHKAQSLCDQTYNNILQEFYKNSLSGQNDIKILQSLQLLYEMNEFLKFVDTNAINQEEMINRFSERSDYPGADSVEFWERLLFHRTCYLKIIKKQFPLLSTKIDDYLFDIQFQLVDSCICQHRTFPALNYLRLCKDISFNKDEHSRLTWILKYSQVWLGSISSHGNVVHVHNLAEIIKGITKSTVLLMENKTEINFCLNHLEYVIAVGDCFWTLGNIFQNNWSSDSYNLLKPVLRISNITNYCEGSRQSIVTNLREKSFEFFQKIIPIYNDICDNDTSLWSSKALSLLSDFCDEQIVLFENDSSQNCDLRRSIVENYVESTLYSMKMGKFSKNKFPRVLQIADKHGFKEVNFSSLINIFSKIPCWMFIPWLEQMMSYLFSTKSLLVESVISRIADEYPHALFYVFQLQLENSSHDQFSVINKIQNKLSSLSLVYEFYTAVHQMTEPEDLLQNWFDEVNLILNDNFDESNRKDVVLKFQQIYQKINNESGSYNLIKGQVKKSPFKQEFCNQFSSIFLKKFQEDGAHIYKLSRDQLKEVQEGLRKEFNQWKEKVIAMTNLADFSPWLYHYNIRYEGTQNSLSSLDQLKKNNWLEVPGQYNNVTSRPFPEKHVKIFKFNSKIQIIKSKQRPKKITIIGDDERSYPFLIKSGEDLRQDFRIQQLFQVMNDILCDRYQITDSTRSSMLLVTYNVIPFSKQIGLLEWIDNTVTLRDFYLKTMTKDEQNNYGKMFKDYYNRFPSRSSFTSSENYDFDDAKRLFEQYQKIISQFDLLRRSFMVIAKDHESFYRLRHKFIRQYATMVAAHYILGIGDRHLGNFLINENTGSIVGIDFGYAFGLGTILLPIPELMPFRLTDSIVQFFRPSGIGGLFTQTLDIVLEAMNANQCIIMSILYVFLANPIIDWGRMSKIIKQPIEIFYPKLINFALKKLRRENPLELLHEQLEIKHSRSPWFNHFKRRNPSTGLRGQTKVLIDMSVNVEYLCKTYEGFEAML